ncbi:hypothetical protein BH23GEM6_BH23GEM6_23610 [soil metagenome]
MLRNRTIHLVAALALVGLAACSGDDTHTRVETDTTMFTQPTTETREVVVQTEDTMMIERRVETDVTVDTTRVDGRRGVGTTRDTIRRP